MARGKGQEITTASDLVGCDEGGQSEVLVCEVKKTEKETKKLLELTIKHATTPEEALREVFRSENECFQKGAGDA